jgi:hypothetical protein
MLMPSKWEILRARGWPGLLVLAQLLITTNAQSQDDLASRRAAAERYEATMPIAKMMEESIEQISLSLPNNQRNLFVAQMRQVVDRGQLRTIALDKMAEVFTAEELDALAAFYGSPVGQTIVTKFPVYMAEIMPVIQRELARAVREVEDRSR